MSQKAVGDRVLETFLKLLKEKTTALVDEFTLKNVFKKKSHTRQTVGNIIKSNKNLETLVMSFSSISKHFLNKFIKKLFDWKHSYETADLSPEAMKNLDQMISSQDHHNFKLNRKSKQSNLLSQFYEERKDAGYYVISYTLLKCIAGKVESIDSQSYNLIKHFCLDYIRKESALFSSTNVSAEVKTNKRIMLNNFSELFGMLSQKNFSEITQTIVKETNVNVKKSDKKTASVLAFILAVRHVKINILSSQGVLDETCEFLEGLHQAFLLHSRKKRDFVQDMMESLAIMLSPFTSMEYSSFMDYSRWMKTMQMYLEKIPSKLSRKQCSFAFTCVLLCQCSVEIFLRNFSSYLDLLYKHYQKNEKNAMRLISTLDSLIHIFEYYLKLWRQNGGVEIDVPESTPQSASEKKKDESKKAAPFSMQHVNSVLKRLSEVVLSPFNKKNKIISHHEELYNVVCNLIAMLSNFVPKFTFRNFIFACVNPDSIITDSMIIGLKSFLEVADQGDINSIKELLDKDREEKNVLPTWVNNLLQRSRRIRASMQISDGFYTQEKFSTQISSFVAMSFSLKNSISKKFTIQDLSNSTVKMFSEEFSMRLGKIIQMLYNMCGDCLETNSMYISRDKFSITRVYSEALKCVPRLIPYGFTPQKLTDYLCNGTIHKSHHVKKISWDVCFQLLEFRPLLRPLMIEAFAKLFLSMGDTFIQSRAPSFIHLQRFVNLLLRWTNTLSNQTENKYRAELLESEESRKKKLRYSRPTVYSFFDGEEKIGNNSVTYPDIVLVDIVGLACLCNLDQRIRLISLKIFRLIREISIKLSPSLQKNSSVWNILEHFFFEMLKEILKEPNIEQCEGHSVTKRIFHDYSNVPNGFEKGVKTFLREVKDSHIISLFYIRLAKYVSKICPQTADRALDHLISKIALINAQLQISYNLKDLDKLDQKKQFQDYLCLWKYLVSMCISFSVEHGSINRKTSKISFQKAISTTPQEPKKTDLISILLPFVKCNYEKQLNIVIEKVGKMHEEMLDILFEHLKFYESNIDAKKTKKKTIDLRIQICRIYSMLGNSIPKEMFRKMKHKNGIQVRFLSFINSQIEFLTKSNNIYSIEYQSLRHNLFLTVESICKKCYYVDNVVPKEVRENLVAFMLQFTGFGKESVVRKEREKQLLALQQPKKKPDSTSGIEETYKKQNKMIEKQAAFGVTALMLGNIFTESDFQMLKKWSKDEKKTIRSFMKKSKSQQFSPKMMEEKATKNLRHDSVPPSADLEMLKKKSILRSYSTGNVLMHSPYVDTFLILNIFKWVDEIIRSNKPNFRKTVAQNVIENVLESHLKAPQKTKGNETPADDTPLMSDFPSPEVVVDFVIEKCFNIDPEISETYFLSFVSVFKRISFMDYPNKMPSLIAVVMLQSVSRKKKTRNFALSLLPRLTNGEVYLLSSGLQEFYDEAFVAVCKTFSRMYKSLAVHVIRIIFEKIGFVAEEAQKKLLESLRWWVKYLPMRGKKSEPETPEESSSDANDETNYILNILFTLTQRYGKKFNEECKVFWVVLSKSNFKVEDEVATSRKSLKTRGSRVQRDDEEQFDDSSSNIERIILFLLGRGREFLSVMGTRIIGMREKGMTLLLNDLYTESERSFFFTCQQIIVFCGISNPIITLNCFINGLENVRDRDDMFSESRVGVNLKEDEEKKIDKFCTLSDVIMVLIVEFVYKHNEIATESIPLILQHCLVRLDHPIPSVVESCKLVLIHLLYTAILKRPSKQEYDKIDICRKLLKSLSKNLPVTLWKRKIDYRIGEIPHIRTNPKKNSRHQLSSADSKNKKRDVKAIREILKSLKILFRQHVRRFEEYFGNEALIWTRNSNSLHNIIRSYQIYRCVNPELSPHYVRTSFEMIERYMESIIRFSEGINEHPTLKAIPPAARERNPNWTNFEKTIFVIEEILFTMEYVVESKSSGEVRRFPQLFWNGLVLSHCENISIYYRTMVFLLAVLKKNPMEHSDRFFILSHNPYPEDYYIGLNTIVKGLCMEKTKNVCLEIIVRMSKMWDDIFFPDEDDNNSVGLTVKLFAFLPHLCNETSQKRPLSPITESIIHDLIVTSQRSRLMEIASVFFNFSQGVYGNSEKFLCDLNKSAEFSKLKSIHMNRVVPILEYLILHCERDEDQMVVLKILHTLYSKSYRVSGKGMLPHLISMTTSDAFNSESCKMLESVICNHRFVNGEQDSGERDELREFRFKPGEGTERSLELISRLLSDFKKPKVKKQKKIKLKGTIFEGEGILFNDNKCHEIVEPGKYLAKKKKLLTEDEEKKYVGEFERELNEVMLATCNFQSPYL